MTANPLSALIGCLAWIPLAVWIVSIVQWIISGDIDFLSGFLGIWLAIGLVVLNAVVAVVLLLRRRRRLQPPPSVLE